jgi:argininosuccinate lyase
MRKIEPKISNAVFDVLSVEQSVTSRISFGGTAPKNVRAQAKTWLKTLAQQRRARPAPRK